MRAHEAGALHGQGDAPAWLLVPEDVNALMPELWPASVDKNDEGVLTVGGLAVTDIAAEVGTPAFVMDEDDFKARALGFKTAFEEAFAPLSGAHVCYASKAFICSRVASWINELGLGLDVASGTELALGLRGGMDPARVTLHGNNKADWEVRRALEAGVGRIVIDSLDEVQQLERLAAEAGIRQAVLVRVRVGVEAHTHEFISTAHEDQKFGLSLANGEALAGALAIEEADHLELVGLHSHIGSQIFDTSGFTMSASRLLGLAAEVAGRIGRELPELDLGGGFGVAYTTGHDPLSPVQLAQGFVDIVRRECETLGINVPHIAIEPGRAIAAPSTFTLYSVGVTKQVQLDGGFARNYVSVDGGMSDNIRTALYSADYSATLASRYSQAAPVLSRVVGKHCESGDIVVKDEYLPADIARGDLLAVPVTGGYCRSMASNYNQLLRPPVVSISHGEISTLVRRETEDDLLALDVL